MMKIASDNGAVTGHFGWRRLVTDDGISLSVSSSPHAAVCVSDEGIPLFHCFLFSVFLFYYK